MLSKPSGKSTIPNMWFKTRFYNKSDWASLVPLVVLLGISSAVMTCVALRNTVGVAFYGIVTLDPAQATIWYWVVSALAAGMAIKLVVLTLRCKADPKKLEITADAVLIPYACCQTLRIAYTDVQSVYEAVGSKETRLYVVAGDRIHIIPTAVFPDIKTYSYVRDLLASHASD